MKGERRTANIERPTRNVQHPTVQTAPAKSAGETDFTTHPATEGHWAGTRVIDVPDAGALRMSFGAGDGKTSYGTLRLYRLGPEPDLEG